MYILNAMDTATVRTTIKAAALAIGFAIVFALSYYAVALVMPVIVAALTAAFAVVVTVASVLAHAAAYAVTTLLWCAARVVVALALVLVLPWLWRAAAVVWAHRYWVMMAAKGLALAGVVVSVFIVALVWLPIILTACCTVLPQAGIVAGVFGGAAGLMKVG